MLQRYRDYKIRNRCKKFGKMFKIKSNFKESMENNVRMKKKRSNHFRRILFALD